MKQVNVGLLGCGTVGSGVARILIHNRELIQSRLGAVLNLKYVADSDPRAGRSIAFGKGVFIPDAFQVVDDPDIDIVVEMIGGQGIARKLILRAIENGKQVVTANKALLAHHGNALFEAAMKKGVDLAYEASVGGCMPIIKTLRESLVGNRIHSMIGILNGTCNYILSKITREGTDFKSALADAQARGYAEADPTLDIEGMDTAHKLAIIVSLAYGIKINYDDIYIEGISRITPMDIAFAREFGYTIKLLAIGKKKGDRIEARVHPTMIPSGNLLSNVNGSLNAVTVSGDAVGNILLYGHGAGMMPTGSAVVGDIVDIARNLIHGSIGRIPLLCCQPDQIRQIPIMPIDELETNYYFRFAAMDSPGVLSKIAGILGGQGISIQSVHQKGRKSNGSVPIVMLTHQARESGVRQAMAEIQRLDVVTDEPMLIRIEETNSEA